MTSVNQVPHLNPSVRVDKIFTSPDGKEIHVPIGGDGTLLLDEAVFGGRNTSDPARFIDNCSKEDPTNFGILDTVKGWFGGDKSEVIKNTLPDGSTTNITIGKDGKPIKAIVTNPEGARATTDYDEKGQVKRLETQDLDGSRTTTVFDENGKPKESTVINPDGSSGTTVYDRNGKPVKAIVIDPNGTKKEFPVKDGEIVQ